MNSTKTMRHIVIFLLFIGFSLYSCHNNKAAEKQTTDITAEMALEGVSNYCHKVYDWNSAKDNPEMMYVRMGEETSTVYKVIFRSYTGAFVYFYVDKTNGATRLEEHVPALNVTSEAGTININDYLKKE